MTGGRSCVGAVVAVALLGACSSGTPATPATPVVVPSGTVGAPGAGEQPTGSPTSGGAPSGSSPPSGGSSASEPTTEPVEVRGAPDSGVERAVVTSLASYLGDWMAVAGSPQDPSLRTSRHATPDGEAELEQVARTLTEAGNGIEGDVVVVDPVVTVAGGVSAEVAMCVDQSATSLVAVDGTVLDSSEEPRVRASAGLVLAGDAWQVATFDVSGEGC